MKAKIIKIITSISLGGGVLTTLPFTTTSCSFSNNNPKLVCDDDTIPGDITGNLDSEISPTVSLLNHIKTDTGESVSGVTFTCDGLPNGLSINQSTGVIFGTPTQVQESTSYIIKFSCTFKEIQLEGSTKINIEVNGPQSIVCSQIEDRSIVVNESFSLGVVNVKMVFDGGTQRSLSSSDIASYELVDDKGQSAASTLPQGLNFNTNNGSISGTVTSLNYYAPTTYKIKITGSQRIGSVIGYSNTFTLSMKDNPLPETVYDIDENNVLKGFKEGVDLSQYDGICDTMQIPARVTEIQDDLHFGLSIPSFIKKLTFPEGSQCTRMGSNSIKNASSITLVDLSNCAMLSIIGSGSFQNCSLLESIIFPSSLNQIGAYVFMADSSLTSITWNS